MQKYTKSQNAALLALRLIVASIFFYAAYGKLFVWSGASFGLPALLVNIMKLLTIAEPLGALGVLIGFLTSWAAAGLSIIMVGAIFVMQFMMHIGFSLPANAGWNFPLMVLGGTLILAAFGAGDWSADSCKRKKLIS
jgi:putative oxidoreductase